MAKKTRVGVLGKVFIEWSGGVDFITYIANALAENKDLEVHFLIPDTNKPLHIYDYKIPSKARRQYNKFRTVAPEVDNPLNPAIDKLNDNIKVKYYRNTPSDFLSLVDRLGIQLLVPTTETFGKNFPLPWVGYIWDFQHRHLPENFDAEQIQGRDKIFEEILSDAPAVLVNSRTTKNDISEFFPSQSKKTHLVSLPFAPNLDESLLSRDSEKTLKKYKIRNKYFIICNQFWLHKDHATAIKAFGEIAKKYPKVDLVCTGKLEEPRDPNYIKSLNALIKELGLIKRVHILGYIPKNDQLMLIKSSLGLIQPTLYEGGPGGGAAYNAASLGTPIIASDIPVNLELRATNLSFFQAGSSSSLAEKMDACLISPKTSKSDADIRAESRKNLELLSQTLRDLVTSAIVQWKKGN